MRDWLFALAIVALAGSIGGAVAYRVSLAMEGAPILGHVVRR